MGGKRERHFFSFPYPRPIRDKMQADQHERQDKRDKKEEEIKKMTREEKKSRITKPPVPPSPRTQRLLDQQQEAEALSPGGLKIPITYPKKKKESAENEEIFSVP